MTAVSLSPVPIQDFFIDGSPAVGGKLFVYQAGTLTKLTTYIDSGGVTPSTNPIIMNARGEPQNVSGGSVGIWIPSGVAYKLVFTTATDTDPPTTPIWTVDNINSSGSVVAGQATFATLALAIAASVPSGTTSIKTLGYYASGDGGGAIYVTASAGAGNGKFQSADGAWWIISTGQNLNVKMFGAKLDDSTDDRVDAQAALTFAQAAHVDMFLPAGTMCISSPGLSITGSDMQFYGAGKRVSNILYTSVSGTALSIGDTGGASNPAYITVRDMSFGAQTQMTSGQMLLIQNGQKINAFHLTFDFNLFWGIVLNSGSNQFTYKLDDIESYSGQQGILIGVVDTVQDLWMSRMTISNATFIGVNFNDCSGFYFTDCDILTCNIGVQMSPSVNIVEAGFCRAVAVDTSTGIGWNINPNSTNPSAGFVTDILFESCWASNNGIGSTNNHGWFVAGGQVSGNRVSGISWVNCISHGNGGDGIVVVEGVAGTSIGQCHITAPSCSANGKHGIEFGAGVTDFSVIGGFSGAGGVSGDGNTQYGVLVNIGASDRYTILTNTHGNTVGGILDGGTGINKIVYDGLAGSLTNGETTVTNLPSASAAGAGARFFVTDATATTFLSTVAGSGSNKVPVVSDGTNWKIG